MFADSFELSLDLGSYIAKFFKLLENQSAKETIISNDEETISMAKKRSVQKTMQSGILELKSGIEMC